jgi:predicted nucleotidyltransferase
MDRQSVIDSLDPVVWRFARRLREEIDAERVLLFGSYARGTAYRDSDYDFIIVSPRYRTIHPMERTFGLHEIFYRVGGYAPLDFICLTPEEFEAAKGRITLVAAVLPEAIDLLAPETTPA